MILSGIQKRTVPLHEKMPEKRQYACVQYGFCVVFSFAAALADDGTGCLAGDYLFCVQQKKMPLLNDFLTGGLFYEDSRCG